MSLGWEAERRNSRRRNSQVVQNDLDALDDGQVRIDQHPLDLVKAKLDAEVEGTRSGWVV